MRCEPFPDDYRLSPSRSTPSRDASHRHLRRFAVVDLKMSAYTHADSWQVHLYLNYAREQ